MNKKILFSDLIDKIAKETGATKQCIHDLLKETINITKEGLEQSGKVKISGLGQFNLKWHKSKQGRNPKTGKTIQIPAQNSIQFKAETSLRNYINREYSHLKPKKIEDEITTPYSEVKQGTSTALDPEPHTIPLLKQTPLTELPKNTSETEQQKQKKLLTWIWWIIPLIFLFIIYFLWQNPKSQHKVAEDITTIESSTSDIPKTPTDHESNLKRITITHAKTNKINHEIQNGDKIWDLSQKYYNNNYLWPNIYHANQATIGNPDILLLNYVIQIPALEGNANNLTKNDSTNITKGYIHTYLIYKKSGKSNSINYLKVAKGYDPSNIIHEFNNKIDKNDLRKIEK